MIIREEIKVIASPNVPLGRIAVPYRLYYSVQAKIGDLIDVGAGGSTKRCYLDWATPEDDKKATRLAQDKWVCINADAVGIDFDFHINDAPSVTLEEEFPPRKRSTTTPPNYPQHAKAGRDYLINWLGEEHSKDMDIDVWERGYRYVARVYYKPIAQAVGEGKGVGLSVRSAVRDTLYHNLEEVRDRINALLEKISGKLEVGSRTDTDSGSSPAADMEPRINSLSAS